MEDLTGRYLKMLKKGLSGIGEGYKVGDYLMVLDKRDTLGLYTVEKVGVLSLQATGGNRITMGDVELMPEGFLPPGMKRPLTKFPQDGVCWQPTKELREYLSSTYKQYSSNTSSKGVAWNGSYFWMVEKSSNQPEYHISQLEPFFRAPRESVKIAWDFMVNPTTDNFEIGSYYYVRDSMSHDLFMVTRCVSFNSLDKHRINGPYLSNMGSNNFNFSKGDTPWINAQREVCLATPEDIRWLDSCIAAKKFVPKKENTILPGNRVIVDYPGDVTHGVKGIVDKITKESEVDRVYFKRPLPPHPGGGELLAVPLCKVRLLHSLPEKWCIKVTHQNSKDIHDFLHKNSHEWHHYVPTWQISPGDSPRYENYFHYPPVGGPAHSELRIQKGYIEITTGEFIKHVLTHTEKSKTINNKLNLKEDEHRIRAIKVQRPNFTIRECDISGAVGIRCPKSKIKIGSESSSD